MEIGSTKSGVFVQIDAISFQMQNPILTLKLEEKITCIYILNENGHTFELAPTLSDWLDKAFYVKSVLFVYS